jgi:uncharacterized protein
MCLDLKNIADGPLGFDRTLTLTRVCEDNPDLLEPPDVRILGSVTASEDRTNPAEGASLVARVEGQLQLRCCRCLEPFDQPLGTDFRLTLRCEVQQVVDPELQIDSSETGFFEIEASKLELDTVAAEQVYLNLPQKPLCGSGCVGLCPTCGVNRNLLECDCRVETLDPRLQVLQQIRDKMGQSDD